MAKDFESMEASNASGNPSIHEVSDPARRLWLRGGLGASVAGLLSPLAVPGGALGALLAGCSTAPPLGSTPLLGFSSVALSEADSVTVPKGYMAQVLQAWGEPVGVPGNAPAFRFDGSNSAADQALQMGMHHDGLGFFALDGRSDRGLLVSNHEYADHGLLFTDGGREWGPEQVAKSQAAHGFSVTEIARQADGSWQAERSSRRARRITAATPHVGGPAAGHKLMRTAADPEGPARAGHASPTARPAARPGAPTWPAKRTSSATSSARTAPTSTSGAGACDPASSTATAGPNTTSASMVERHPNEPNRFGWVVEFDPYDPDSVPVKRTALGRAAHEGATVAMTGRPCRRLLGRGRALRVHLQIRQPRQASAGWLQGQRRPAGPRHAVRGAFRRRRQWPLAAAGARASGGLTPENDFADQGEVLIKARQASDAPGRHQDGPPEWIAVDPQGNVYCTLTNNSQRGAPGRPGVDAANPRENNTGGHILRWKEDGDFDGETLRVVALRAGRRPPGSTRWRARPDAGRRVSPAPTACLPTPAVCCGFRPT
jgi:secreted PhoX family phosphatase